MPSKPVCRTCLSANFKMHDLRNTQLQEIFEKLTSIKLNAEAGWTRICYICYSQLQRCQRFSDMSRKADKMFQQVLAKGIELTPEQSVSMSVLRPTNNFIVTPVDGISVPEYAMETLVTVKIEPTDIKEEVIELEDSRLFEAVKLEVTESPVAETDGLIKIVCEQETLIENIIDEEPYTCNVCSKTFKKQKSWKKHVSDIHNRMKAVHACKECNKEFTRIDLLKRHMAIHTGEIQKPYECDMCDKTFYMKLTFQNHMRTHTKPYACHLCDKSFSELSSRKKHVASHKVKVKPFICGRCNKGFTHKSFLVVHIRTHTGEKPFACGLCDKKFSQIAHAISHKRSHTCHLCEKTFAQIDDAISHKKTHRNIDWKLIHKNPKYFSCKLCENSFSLKTTLNKHMRTHTGEKPYACEICHKTFSIRDTLKSHMRSHTGEKPYTCNICGKAFSQRGNMRKHVKMHEIKPDDCSQDV